MSKELEAFRKLMERLSNNVTIKEWDLCNKDMQIVEDFIEQALKHQEPMKVLKSNNTGIFSGKCGSCGEWFHKIDGRLDFCHKCGQKLDWTD